MNITVRSAIRERWRELVRFAICFRVVEGLLFAPLAALAARWFTGQAVLDSTAVVSFLLSPRGLIAALFGAAMLLGLRLIEHAGLSVILFAGLEGLGFPARAALRVVRRHLRVLLGLSFRFVGIGLVVVLPLLAVAGGFAARLLPRHDVNYYLKLRPPEFITAAVVIGLVALATSVVMMAMVVRWRWVVQVALFERKEAGRAFAESAALTRGVRWKLAGALVSVTLASLALGLLASLLGGFASSIVLGVTGWSRISLAISFVGLLLLRAIITAACTLLGSWLDAGVFTSLYRRRRRAIGGETSLPGADDAVSAGGPRWLLAAAVMGFFLFAAGGTWLALGAISDERAISIHAHRGVWTRAPENSLAAIREAIAAGADYLETDVQMSRDGVLVVVHDSDFSRLGGVAKRVWDLTYEEIRAIPIGQGAAPEFRGEITPTFDALLEEAKGRIKVNIELKYYGDHQPGLARKVVEAVRAHGMLDEVVIQCLEYEPLLEVRQLAPSVPIGYLLSFNARKPARLDVDFLSVEQNRLDHPFILGAHGRGQRVYAWTVNSADDLERLLDLGVDGVITDSTALARRTLDDYLRLPPPERALRRVRAWLAD